MTDIFSNGCFPIKTIPLVIKSFFPSSCSSPALPLMSNDGASTYGESLTSCVDTGCAKIA